MNETFLQPTDHTDAIKKIKFPFYRKTGGDTQWFRCDANLNVLSLRIDRKPLNFDPLNTNMGVCVVNNDVLMDLYTEWPECNEEVFNSKLIEVQEKIEHIKNLV